MMNSETKQLISELQLIPHPEGGYYKEVYRSESTVISPYHGHLRHAITDIYFLLLEGQNSRFHRLVHDEIWHFYKGDSLVLVDLSPDIQTVSQITLGNLPDKNNFKYRVRGGHWQSAYSTGEYSLVGCTVAPGFEFDDFSFLKDDQVAYQSVIDKFPELKTLI